ncbi:MAG: TRAP transporter fused permease subunit [Acidobacteria bacterium]|nr:TRAP transporter fused permease subunit [Acidobacteriota bacterium]MYJ04602.1 TRAP transporter fused permease subunit [Acidobacteriota bacterium]
MAAVGRAVAQPHTPRDYRLLASGALGVFLCVFTLVEVNYPLLAPQSRLALFALAGLALCFLQVPIHSTLKQHPAARASDIVLAALAVGCCGYIVVQTDLLFEAWWIDGQALGNRAGFETTLDTAIGLVGLLLVIEAARRALGLALPLLAGAFILYALFGSAFPDWLFPHRGYSVERIVAQTFLHSQGVFGVALGVMFTYVFLFVIFGAFLEATGATRFIVDFAERVFGRSSGGPAKVAVLSSGLMGSLSGSAVANTATTGTFTIPMMRSAGFRPVTAAGVQAAASSGGALMPPVMGAGAYMMLEIVEPPVTYLEVIRAALIPALLYYLSLLLIVHFHAKRMAGATAGARADAAGVGAGGGGGGDTAGGGGSGEESEADISRAAGIVFGSALASLIVFLLLGYTAFRAVTLSLAAIVVVSSLSRETRLDWRGTLTSLANAARGVVPLVAAAACVGIIIGIVTLTGVGTRLPATIIPLAEQSLFLALVLIMVSSIILGMGLPSAVCYLLMATLIGPVLGDLGVIPLAAHLFIFYFGMMSMVTPPVALAAYAASSIANTRIMPTAFAAFRFALVGFTLPYMFIYRPELLMLTTSGEAAGWLEMLLPVAIATLGVGCFAAGIAGQLRAPLGLALRLAVFVAAALLLAPGPAATLAGVAVPVFDLAGVALFGVVLALNRPAA